MGKCEGRNHLQYVGVCGRIILRVYLEGMVRGEGGLRVPD